MPLRRGGRTRSLQSNSDEESAEDSISSAPTSQRGRPSSANGSASLSSGGNELDALAREAVTALQADNVPPFPAYYQLYFEKILDEKPADFKKNILELIESESATEDEKRLRIEKQFKEGFSISKKILESVATLYKNINMMGEITKRRVNESTNINNPSAVKNLAIAINNDMQKLQISLEKQSVQLKDLYSKSANILKEVKGHTIYDAVYGVYNRTYLESQMVSELKHIEKFGHKTTILIVVLSSKVISNVPNPKQINLINRTVSKLLLKTSRRSDVVSHLGNGEFAMLLKHTDEDNAGRAAKRLSEMLAASHFFIGEKEIKLEIAVGISTLNCEISIDDTIKNCQHMMDEADKENIVFKIHYNKKKEEDDSDGFDLPE